MKINTNPARIPALIARASIFLALLASLSACTIDPASDPTPFRTPVITTPSNTLPAPGPTTDTGPAFEVYFTDPDATGVAPLEKVLVSAIDGAKTSIDMAMYNINLESLLDALIRAHRSGVRVRVVMESDAIDKIGPQRLIGAGIEVLGDRKEGLMHNKFLVIDGRETWTGSLNLTLTGIYDDHNHMVRVRSGQISANYTTEFNEMFEGDDFGPGSPANTPYPELTLDGYPVRTMFSPDDGVSDELVALLEGATETVSFLAYSFTSDPIAETLLDLDDEGVQVRGVFEEEQVYSNIGTEWDRLLEGGLEVRMDTNPGQMHHKVFIIDGEWVALGSYNFSANAENRNDENVLMIQSPPLAAQFQAEFERIYAAGRQ